MTISQVPMTHGPPDSPPHNYITKLELLPWLVTKQHYKQNNNK